METSPIDTQTLVDRLNNHPRIKQRIAAVLAVAENAQGDLKRADDAEMRLIEEVRRMGQEALQSWAEHQVRQSEQALRTTARVSRQGKKNSAGTPRSAT
jgi:uncharacterized protein with von Willebrand factor type A (vWA) domain